MNFFRLFRRCWSCFVLSFFAVFCLDAQGQCSQPKDTSKREDVNDSLLTIAHQYLTGMIRTPFLRKDNSVRYVSDLHAHSMLYPYLNSRLGIVDPSDQPLTSQALSSDQKAPLSWNMLENNPLSNGARKKMEEGERTDFELYPQSDLPNLAKGNVRNVVMCFHPLEKGFTEKKVHRFISHNAFSGVLYPKLRFVGGQNHSSFRELMGEYYLAINHVREYGGLSIQFPKSYMSTSDKSRMNIYLAFEGAHALFDEEANESLIAYDRSLNKARHQMLRFKRVDAETQRALNEGLHEVNSQAPGIALRVRQLKTLDEGRFVYATMTHLLNNGLMGQAKGFDSGKGKQRIGLDIVFHNHDVLKALKLEEQIIKTKPGIRDLGYSTLFELLDTEEYSIAVDIKHMDPFSRFDYFKLLEKNIRYGGAWTEKKLKGIMEDPKFYDSYFEVYQSYDLNKYQPIISSHSGLSRLDFKRTLQISTQSADLNKWRSNKIMGWTAETDYPLLYAMPINLSNEEVLLIYASRGLVGLMLDERLIGGSLMRYKDRFLAPTRVAKDYREKVESTLDKKSLKQRIEQYSQLEPLLRNIFSTVAIVYDQCENDRLFALEALRRYYLQAFQIVSTKEEFNFTNFKRSIRLEQNFDAVVDSMKMAFVLYAWDHVCLGSDYDGIIDPVDAYSTASTLPQLWADCIDFLDEFILIDPDRLNVGRLLIADHDLLFQKFFQLNLENYLRNHAK